MNDDDGPSAEMGRLCSVLDAEDGRVKSFDCGLLPPCESAASYWDVDWGETLQELFDPQFDHPGLCEFLEWMIHIALYGFDG